jgi:hypothetical protein
MLRQPPFTCNSLQQSAQIFTKCGTHLKTLVARRVTKSEVYTEDAQAFSRHDDLSPAICAPLYCSFVTLPFDATQLEIIAASLKAMLSAHILLGPSSSILLACIVSLVFQTVLLQYSVCVSCFFWSSKLWPLSILCACLPVLSSEPCSSSSLYACFVSPVRLSNLQFIILKYFHFFPIRDMAAWVP